MIKPFAEHRGYPLAHRMGRVDVYSPDSSKVIGLGFDNAAAAKSWIERHIDEMQTSQRETDFKAGFASAMESLGRTWSFLDIEGAWAVYEEGLRT